MTTVILMTAIEVLLLVAVVLILLPYASYTAVKLGTVGYLRGRELFDNKKKEE
jgi:hypothetical protein